jgi:hypothetical protein
VSNKVAGTGQTTVVGAEVTAEMTATVSVDGMPGGVCASPPTPIPTNGTGQLSCTEPESAALAQSLLAEKKAALGNGGGTVSVTITAQVEVHATALTEVEVAQQVDRLKQQQRQARGSRAPPAVPREGLKVGAVNLGARQYGTAAAPRSALRPSIPGPPRT